VKKRGDGVDIYMYVGTVCIYIYMFVCAYILAGTRTAPSGRCQEGRRVDICIFIYMCMHIYVYMCVCVYIAAGAMTEPSGR